MTGRRSSWATPARPGLVPAARPDHRRTHHGTHHAARDDGARRPKSSWRGLQTVGATRFEPRPLAPQGPPMDFHGVAPVSTECHPAELTEVCRTGSFDTEAPNAYETTPFGAPVARLRRVRWLTPGEVAARLRVCRATVYKLCDAGQLGYARVGLSIRISEQQLEARCSRIFLVVLGSARKAIILHPECRFAEGRDLSRVSFAEGFPP